MLRHRKWNVAHSLKGDKIRYRICMRNGYSRLNKRRSRGGFTKSECVSFVFGARTFGDDLSLLLFLTPMASDIKSFRETLLQSLEPSCSSMLPFLQFRAT